MGEPCRFSEKEKSIKQLKSARLSGRESCSLSEVACCSIEQDNDNKKRGKDQGKFSGK
jgi:hypothetical protein